MHVYWTLHFWFCFNIDMSFAFFWHWLISFKRNHQNCETASYLLFDLTEENYFHGFTVAENKNMRTSVGPTEAGFVHVHFKCK